MLAPVSTGTRGNSVIALAAVNCVCNLAQASRLVTRGRPGNRDLIVPVASGNGVLHGRASITAGAVPGGDYRIVAIIALEIVRGDCAALIGVRERFGHQLVVPIASDQCVGGRVSGSTPEPFRFGMQGIVATRPGEAVTCLIAVVGSRAGIGRQRIVAIIAV